MDLNGIADLNSMNESEAENRLARAGFMVTETSFNYLFACILASMATGLPEEFFTGLPLREVLKLKNAVNDSGFFRVKGGAKALRQAAIRLSAVTRTGVDFYLKLPVEEFIALNNEVAEEWHRTKTLELSIKIAGKVDKSLTTAINQTNTLMGSLTTTMSKVGTAGLRPWGRWQRRP